MSQETIIGAALLSERERGWRPSTMPLLPVAFVLFALLAFTWNVLLAHVMSTLLHGNDFGKFYYSARAFLEHRDMYAPSPATELPYPELKGVQFLNMNPPHFHLIVLPFALLEPSTAIGVWMIVGLFSAVFSVLAIANEIDFAWTPSRALAVTAAGLGFAGTQAFFVTGQLSFLLALAVTASWIAARHGRWGLAGTILGLCTSVKPFLLIFAPYLVLTRRWRAVGAAALSGAVWIAAGVAVFGVGSYRSWLAAVGESTEWAWAAMNGSLLAFFSRTFQATPYFAPLTESATALSLWMPVAALVGAATLAVTLSRRSIDFGFALTLLAAQLISPLGWVYYLWLAAGPLAAWVLPRLARAPVRVGEVRWWAGVVVALCLWLPTEVSLVGQPHPLATATLGSTHFWGTVLCWGWLLWSGLASLRKKSANEQTLVAD